MDINSILQTLGNNNIDLGALINLASTFLSGKNQNTNNTLNNAPALPPMQYLQNTDTKTTENSTSVTPNNFSHSYFNMPQYDFSSTASTSQNATQPHMQKNITNPFNQNTYKNHTDNNFYSHKNTTSIEQNYSQNTQNERPSSPTANNLPNMLELLKLVMPLLSKQKEKSQTSVQTAQNLDSTILKLPRAK